MSQTKKQIEKPLEKSNSDLNNALKDYVKPIQTTYTITKKIAKQGKQAVLIIPSILKDKLCAGTLVKVEFEVIK